MEIPAVVRITTNYFVSESAKKWNSLPLRTKVIGFVIAAATAIFIAFRLATSCTSTKKTKKVSFTTETLIVGEKTLGIINGNDQADIETVIQLLQTQIRNGETRGDNTQQLQNAVERAKHRLDNWGKQKAPERSSIPQTSAFTESKSGYLVTANDYE